MILSDSHAVPLRITVAIGYFFCYNGRKRGDLQSEEKGKRTHEGATEEKSSAGTGRTDSDRASRCSRRWFIFDKPI